jgi:hypothetical protein
LIQIDYTVRIQTLTNLTNQVWHIVYDKYIIGI